jgi:predicted acyl esterase
MSDRFLRTGARLFLSILIWSVFAASAMAQKAWEVKVPMRDGVKLATNVYLPEGEGPWPVVLGRTPYAKDRSIRDQKDLPETIVPEINDKIGYIEQGYAQVMQDTRGRYRSEGEFTCFMSDHMDGYDTVEWIAAQPWCDGNVGMVGTSAPGITGIMAAVGAHPALKCVVAGKASGSHYYHLAYHGGVPRRMTERWLTGNKALWYLDVIFAHPNYDDHWASCDARVLADQVQTPILNIGGWFDIFAQSTIETFTDIQSRGAGVARGNQKLIMGPSAHGKSQGDLVFPNANAPGGNHTQRWLDYWLKGADTGIVGEPPVSYYVMGDTKNPGALGNEWRQAPGWPPASRPTPFYLGPNGGLAQTYPTVESSSQTYAYDPKNPVPTIGGFNLQIDKGPMDQRAAGERDDILKFETDVLDRAIEIVGKVDMELWAGSDALDTDWMVQLIDVYPDGYEALMCEGAFRARFREGFDKQVFMVPGEIYRFPIDLWSTALVFNKGHKIAVHVSSSSEGRFLINPNTGKPYNSGDETRVANNTIYHDAAHPSRIILPVTKVYE